MERLVICPACHAHQSVGEDALAEKRAICPNDGPFALTPANVTALATTEPPNGRAIVVLRDDRLLLRSRSLWAIAIGVLGLAWASVDLALRGSPFPGLLVLANIASVTDGGVAVHFGRKWLWTPRGPIARARVVGFVAYGSELHARLRDGGTRRLLHTHSPQEADDLRRRLEGMT